MPLTGKQSNFARFYVETGNASEAYRRAYNAGKMKPESVWRKASEVLSNGKVAARVMELQAKAQERTLVTVESITQELDQARSLAMNEGQPSAAVTAISTKARLHGLFEKDNNQRGGELSDAAKILLGRIGE